MKKFFTNEKVVLFMDKILPFMPISLFILLGIVFSSNDAGWQAGLVTAFVPIMLSIFQGVWVYKIKPHYITEE